MRSRGVAEIVGVRGNAKKKLGVAPQFRARFVRVSSSVPHPFLIRLAIMPVDSAVLALVALKIHFFNCSVYNYTHTYKRNNSSGGPYITGWIVTLLPYAGRGNRRNDYLQCWDKTYTFGGVKTTYFPRGVVYCPFNWKYLGNDIGLFH